MDIAKGFKGFYMFIDRTFSDITATRVGDLEFAEFFEECWKEKYPDTDFFDCFSIQMFHRHVSGIECEGIPDKIHLNPQGFDDAKKC